VHRRNRCKRCNRCNGCNGCNGCTGCKRCKRCKRCNRCNRCDRRKKCNPSGAARRNCCDRDQIRSAARSVTSNIAEGFPCTHAEFARFLDISARSLREIDDRLIEAVDEEMVTTTEGRAGNQPDEADRRRRLAAYGVPSSDAGPSEFQTTPAAPTPSPHLGTRCTCCTRCTSCTSCTCCTCCTRCTCYLAPAAFKYATASGHAARASAKSVIPGRRS